MLAERSLALNRSHEASSEIWATLSILADIADAEDDVEAARRYRREERAAFAAFPGNRFHIDKQFSKRIAAFAAATEQEALRPALDPVFTNLEAKGWKIGAAIRRIWAGERDWHALTEELDGQDALLVLRVLETLESPAPPPPSGT